MNGDLAIAFLVVGLFVLVLRWTARHGGSLVARPVRPGAPGEYGLLVDVAAPGSLAEADLLRHRLAEHGIRATTARTLDGPRVYVHEEDEARARTCLTS